jgi:membrane protein
MKNILRATIAHWKTHQAQRMGAALAYYAMLSFIPLLFLLVTIAGYVFSQDLVRGTLIIELSKTLGPNVAAYIQQVLQADMVQHFSFPAAVVSAIVTLLGAVAVFAELDQDFDILWDTPKVRQTYNSLRSHIWALVHKKIITLSFVPLLTVLLLIVIAVTVVVGVLGSIVVVPHAVQVLVSITQLVAPVILGTLLFTTMYRLLPQRKLPWRILLWGGFITTILFVVGNVLILEYIKLLVHTDVFGPAASLVGLLVWVYYSAQVFFFGASLTYIYAKQKGLIPSREKVQS